jgi:hypothetical protein
LDARPIAADFESDYFALSVGALAKAVRVGTLLLAQGATTYC